MGEVRSRNCASREAASPRRWIRSRRWWLAGLVVIAAWLAPADTASAQGTFGATPEPITSGDLELIAERLWMSESQILEMINAHQLYKQEFRKLREGKVQELIDRVKDIRPIDNGMMPELPPRSELESLVELHESICRRAKQLDEQFFNVVQGQLSPEQAAEVTRVRRFRARQRCHDIVVMQFSRGSGVDFITMLEEIELEPETRTIIEPILASYDVSLTRRTEALYQSTIDLVMLMYDQINASGLLDMDLMDMDPIKMMKAAAAVEMSWQNAKGQYQDDLDKITKLNRRTHQQLASVLPEKPKRELRRTYSRAAYGRANPRGVLADRFFDRARDLDGLTSEQREAIDALAMQFDMIDARITEKMMDAIDQYRMTRKLIEMDGTDRTAMRESVDKLREERVTSSDQMIAQLKDILGETLAAKLGEAESQDVGVAGEIGVVRGDDGAVATIDVVGTEAVVLERPDTFVPGPMDERDLRWYESVLGLSDDQMLVARTLHSDYMEKYRTLVDERIEAIQTQANNMNWRTDPPPTLEGVAKLYDQRLALRESIRGLDNAFFADLELTILDESQAGLLPAVKAGRTRMVLTGGKDDPQYSWGQGDATRINIDLHDLVQTFNLTSDLLREAQQIIARADLEGVPAYRAYDEARRARTRKIDEVMVLILQGGERNWELFQDVQPFQKALGDAKVEVAKLQEKAVREIASKLDAGTGMAFEDEYYRRAYPEIYSDGDSARDEFRAAVRLPDLSIVQKSRIEALAAAYRDEYHTISRKLIDYAREGDVPPPDAERAAQNDFIDRQLAKTLLEFDREELSLSYILRLRAILDEDQAAKVLGKVSRDIGFSFDF